MDKISIVTSLYGSESFIDEFFNRHLEVLKKLNVDYEFVFVNDGSPDGSKEKVLQLLKQNSQIKLVDLSRNFGQHAAMFSGMSLAEGSHVCALDCDLEEEPENLVDMYRIMKADPSIDVVFGVISNRTGGFVRRVLGGLFYTILDLIADVRIPRDQGWQRLMSKRYVDSLMRFTEARTLPAGLMALAGYKQVPFPMEKSFKGNTTYSFSKRLRFALNSITGLSSKPLIFICLLGFFITGISTLGVALIIAMKLLSHEFQSGWISVITSVWLVGGLLMVSVGIVGVYIARIFDQVKARPLYIVREIYQS